MDLPGPFCAVVADTMPVTPRLRLLLVPSALMSYSITFPRFPRYPLILVVLHVAGIPNEGRLVPPTSKLTRLTPETVVIEPPMNDLLETLFIKVSHLLVVKAPDNLVRCVLPKLTLVMNYFPVTSR